METTHFSATTLDKQRTSYWPLNQIMRKTQEETRSDEDNSSKVTTLDSSNFEDMWSFNHPHLNMKECWEKLHWVEVLVEKGNFQAFYEEECNDYNYDLETSLLRV